MGVTMLYENIETDQLCYKTTAMQILGLTHAQFQKLGLKPVKYEKNPMYLTGWVHMYDRPLIKSMINDPRVVAMRGRRRTSKFIGNINITNY